MPILPPNLHPAVDREATERLIRREATEACASRGRRDYVYNYINTAGEIATWYINSSDLTEGFQVTSTTGTWIAQWPWTTEEESPHEEQKLPEKKQNPRLLKDMQMECRDVLLNIYTDQPQILQRQYFYTSPYEGRNRRHRYQREQSVMNGGMTIFDSQTYSVLAWCASKPHPTICYRKFGKGELTPRLNYMRSLIKRTVYESVPQVKVVNRH